MIQKELAELEFFFEQKNENENSIIEEHPKLKDKNEYSSIIESLQGDFTIKSSIKINSSTNTAKITVEFMPITIDPSSDLLTAIPPISIDFLIRSQKANTFFVGHKNLILCKK